jgi:hypothetical protein
MRVFAPVQRCELRANFPLLMMIGVKQLLALSGRQYHPEVHLRYHRPWETIWVARVIDTIVLGGRNLQTPEPSALPRRQQPMAKGATYRGCILISSRAAAVGGLGAVGTSVRVVCASGSARTI